MKKLFAFICSLLVASLIFAQASTVYAASTPTATPSATQQTGTPATPTATSQQTGTPGTPSATYTPTASPSSTPTTTLMPLPAITLVFPAYTATGTPTVTPEPVRVTETPKPPMSEQILSLTPRIKLLLGFVAALWIILAAFAIIYIRQFR